MINPEPTDLLVSRFSASYLAARIFTATPLRGGRGDRPRRRARRRRDGAAVLLWTLAVVVLAFARALWARARRAARACYARSRSRSPRCVVVAGPWYGYRAANYANADLRPAARATSRSGSGAPARFYVDPRAARRVLEAVPAAHGESRLAADVHGHLGRLVRRLRVAPRRMRCRRAPRDERLARRAERRRPRRRPRSRSSGGSCCCVGLTAPPRRAVAARLAAPARAAIAG